MTPRKMADGVYSVGAVDWDRRLFDSLIPLPDGTSYNSYLVRGSDATALIDGVDPTKTETLRANLDQLGVTRLDYLIVNHTEQDHSGGVPAILEWYPNAKVICTAKCADLLNTHVHLAPDRIQTVEDGETLSLGNRTFEFIHAPWVHWPETMITYLREDKILFSCDLFGSHLAQSDLYAHDRCRVDEAGKRYFAEIMMPFSRNIMRHLERLANYEIAQIGPSHGPAHDDPAFIMDLYKEWAGHGPRNQALIAYVSMHGSTAMLTERLVSALVARGVQVERFDLVSVDLGKLASALVDSASLLIGTPTVLAGPHPFAAQAAFLANALRPQAKFAGVYGSYGWGTRVDQQIAAAFTNIRVELYPPVLIKGMPRAEDYALIDALADSVAQKHKDAGLA
ncbi:MAG: FprA family A-type flavoprotein [Anaerolineae bacterium]